jgi:hypothetical protein
MRERLVQVGKLALLYVGGIWICIDAANPIPWFRKIDEVLALFEVDKQATEYRGRIIP